MRSRLMSDDSRPIFAGFTVRQSSCSTPPVSPEFGFHAQKVQLIPFWPM